MESVKKNQVRGCHVEIVCAFTRGINLAVTGARTRARLCALWRCLTALPSFGVC